MRIDGIKAAPQAEPNKAQLYAAGAAFEAMMLKQILQMALPSPGDSAGDWQGLALDSFARDLAAAHPFGVARLLEPKP